jgi:hypothetical protein
MLTMDVLDNLPVDKLSGCWYLIAENPRMTLDFVRKHWDSMMRNNVSKASYLTEEFILEKGFISFNYNAIIKNPRISHEFILEQQWRISDDMEVIKDLSQKPNLPLAFILKHITLIDMDSISTCTTLSPEFIREYAHLLNWDKLSRNVALTMPLIREHIDCIDWKMIAFNPNLDIEFMLEYVDKIDKYYLTSNACVTMDIILKYQHLVDWRSISHNPNLTLQYIKECLQKRIFQFHNIYKHSAITIEFVEENLHKCDGSLYNHWTDMMNS